MPLYNNDQKFPDPLFQKNDKKAKTLIWIFSIVVFTVVALLGNFRLNVSLGFDANVFATFNAAVNSIVAILLIAALIAVKNGKYILHKKIMLVSLVLSILFLVSYIAHRLFAGDTVFGDINHDGLLSDNERSAVGSLRTFYLVLLSSHIFLAAVILPFILFTAYRALVAEFPLHKKLARYTWPLWLYVSITGPIIYFMIKPYYK